MGTFPSLPIPSTPTTPAEHPHVEVPSTPAEHPHVEVLRRIGFTTLIAGRYPFTYHHDYVRSEHSGNDRIPSTLTNGSLSRSCVARYMSTTFRGRYGDAAYEAAIYLGAILYLARENPYVFATAMINDGEFRALVEGIYAALRGIPKHEMHLTPSEPSDS